MNAHEVIKKVENDASEWLEMVENPTELVVGVLAHKIVALQGYIEYLERRLEHADSTKTRIN